MGLVARVFVAARLPLGAWGAMVAGGLGAFCGASFEALIVGGGRLELNAGSAGGALAGATVVLFLFARAGVADPFRSGASRVS